MVQGVTEPLPISSSGHLILVPWLFGWRDVTEATSFNKTFDVALHLGTLVGVVAYFWRDILTILAGAWRGLRKRALDSFEEKLPWYIVIATIPGAVFGALGEGLIEGPLGIPAVVAVELIVFGVVLFAAERYTQRLKELEALKGKESFLIGLAQALALMPGVSRSGITMTAALTLRFTREAAARFSFLISIPVIAGALLYKGLTTFVTGEGLPPGAASQFVLGILASTVTGFVSVWLLLKYIRTHTFTPFVVYRISFGVLILIVAGFRA